MKTKLDTSIPVNFVCPEDLVWPELQNGADLPLSGEILTKRSGRYTNNWVLRPYHGLLARGEDISLSSTAVPGAINIVSPSEITRSRVRDDEFLVCAHGDAHITRLANFRIRQNFLRKATASAANVFHFPQPGIVHRDSSRGASVEHVTFKGHINNLHKDLRSDYFFSKLNDMGMKIEIDKRDFLTGEHCWNNYYEADIVLAFRDITNYRASHKPASKLINAWMAGVPALLGPEPAFEELRKSELDYIIVESADDALRELQRLQRNPTLYQEMVANGLSRSKDYTEDVLLDDWVAILNGPVASLAREWYTKSETYRRLLIRNRRIEEKFCARIHKIRSQYGQRLSR